MCVCVWGGTYFPSGKAADTSAVSLSHLDWRQVEKVTFEGNGRRAGVILLPGAGHATCFYPQPRADHAWAADVVQIFVYSTFTDAFKDTGLSGFFLNKKLRPKSLFSSLGVIPPVEDDGEKPWLEHVFYFIFFIFKKQNVFYPFQSACPIDAAGLVENISSKYLKRTSTDRFKAKKKVPQFSLNKY